ncbi:hypothetical protein GCM10022280_25300 [Sphingomonas swuensis]|uniref:Uncharacterized protein n=2 Tax=Sphingomonas swuensis TaxID=977800 RepID=A0ABP7TAP1_9SPHN
MASAASAQSMPLAEFVKRGTALEKKGMLALLHKGEINVLMAQMKGSGEALKAEQLAAEKSGKPGVYCRPAGQKRVGFSAQQLLAELRAIPPAQSRSMTISDGFRHIMVKRYPCR